MGALLSCTCGGTYIPKRTLVVILICFVLFVTYTQYVVFNLIEQEFTRKGASNSTSTCRPITSPIHKRAESNHQWTTAHTKYMAQMYYIGQALPQIPLAYVGDKYGAKYVFTTSLLGSSILTGILVSVVDSCDASVVAIVRFFVGVTQASLYPNTLTLIGKWVLPKDRAKATGCAFSIMSLGYVFSRKTGLVYKAINDWQLIVYIFSGLGVVLYFLCLMFLPSGPSADKHLNEKEAEVLEAVEAKQTKIYLGDLCPMMCYDMVLVIAMILTEVTHHLIFFFAVGVYDHYYEHVLWAEMDMLDDLECLMFPVALIAGALADHAIAKRPAKKSKLRKTYVFVGLMVPGLCCVFVPFAACGKTAVSAMRSVQSALMGFYYAGLRVNVVDVTCNYTGMLMGLMGTCSAVLNIFLEDVVASLVVRDTLSEWQVIMWVPMICSVVATLIFVVTGTVEQRGWDRLDRLDRTTDSR